MRTPPLGPLRELVDDRTSRDGTRYDDLDRRPRGEVRRRRRLGARRRPGRRSSSCCGRRPAARRRRSPANCAISRSTGPRSSATALERHRPAGLAIGVLAEEERALHLRFGGGGGGKDVPPDVPSFAAAVVADEAEAFSGDSDWMPRVVLMAKSTYVWLDQLSRRYGRDLRTLDAIPDEELDTLASWGVTSLWLIGLWQRSVASERIKRMRGNPDAVASAYSLDDYRIADDLGGEAAYANLRDRAWARGHPAGQRHGAQSHGHRFGLGHRAPGVVPVPARAAVPGLHLHRGGPVVRSSGSGSCSRTTTGTTRTRPSCSSASTARRATSATSTTATTARAFPGTTPPSSTSCRPRSASTSSG